MLKAVVFDLFETLVTEHGLDKYTKRKIAQDLSVNEDVFSKEWSNLGKERYLGKFQDTESVIKHILSVINEKVEFQSISGIGQKRDKIKNEVYNDIDVNIIEMLEELKKNGYKLGLISNCSYEEITGLKNSKIYLYFDAIILSCEVGICKPDKAIYELCAEKLKIPCSDCLFVGDGGSNELDGAAKSGMTPKKAVWFTKEFVKNFDENKTYPLIYNPAELLNNINKTA